MEKKYAINIRNVPSEYITKINFIMSYLIKNKHNVRATKTAVLLFLVDKFYETISSKND